MRSEKEVREATISALAMLKCLAKDYPIEPYFGPR